MSILWTKKLKNYATSFNSISSPYNNVLSFAFSIGGTEIIGVTTLSNIQASSGGDKYIELPSGLKMDRDSNRSRAIESLSFKII